MAKLSDGAFDITVGPVVRLWRRARRTQHLPTTDELAKAKELVGFAKVLLDAKARTVQLTKAGMQLDLGGIAKGYAADQALAVLKKHGISRALVAAGGDIAVSGSPPDATGWTIAIAPLEGDKASRTAAAARCCRLYVRGCGAVRESSTASATRTSSIRRRGSGCSGA